MVELGENIGGLHRERRIVIAVEDSVVSFYYPISLREDSSSVENFEAWLAELPAE